MSGKSIKSVECKPIPREKIEPTVASLVGKLHWFFGVTKDDVAFIGSTGKKAISGDIDLAVRLQPFQRYSNAVGIKNIVAAIKDDMQSLFQETYIYFGNQFTFPYRIAGTDDYVQVDLMLTPSLEAAKFYYHAPMEGTSKYPAGVRNDLMMGITIHHGREPGPNENEEFRYWYDRFGGLVHGIEKTENGKRTARNKISVSINPDEIIRILIGDNFNMETVDTFENLWAAIHTDAFEGKDHLPEIIETFRAIRNRRKKPIPEEAQ